MKTTQQAGKEGAGAKSNQRPEGGDLVERLVMPLSNNPQLPKNMEIYKPESSFVITDDGSLIYNLRDTGKLYQGESHWEKDITIKFESRTMTPAQRLDIASTIKSALNEKYLHNVRDHQQPLASGATSCVSRNRDRSPEGTAVWWIAWFAFYFSNSLMRSFSILAFALATY